MGCCGDSLSKTRKEILFVLLELRERAGTRNEEKAWKDTRGIHW